MPKAANDAEAIRREARQHRLARRARRRALRQAKKLPTFPIEKGSP
jgi:hypothetical protein